MRVVVVEEVDAGAQRVRAGLMREVVDDLDTACSTRRVGLPDSVPNDGDAGDADGRADRIGRRRLQVAVRELRARLVDGARRERPACC